MTARYEFVEKLKAEVSDRLRKVISNEALHKDLLQKLMVQGMLKLMERNITI
jgi:V-type H+-transporting ATPase subunit E